MSDLTIRGLGKPLVAKYSVVEKYSLAAQFGQMLMLADKQEDRSRRITDKTYDAKDFVIAARALNVTRISRRTKRAAARTSMAGRPGTPVTASA